MRSALDHHDQLRRSFLYDFVAQIAGKTPLVTVAASNDDMSFAAVIKMLDSLKAATRGQVRLLVDRPVNDQLNIPGSTTFSVQAIATAWAAANDVDVESCADTVANQAVLTDPWAIDPSSSIRRWHYVARNVVNAVNRVSLATHVGVFDQWTASRNGVDRSLRHVTDYQFPRVTIHMGGNVPVSQGVGQASFDWMVPLK